MRSRLVAAALLCGLLAGCSDLFVADFEADQVGEPPLDTPPGPPSDLVSVSIRPGPPQTTATVEPTPTETQALTIAAGGDASQAAILQSARADRNNSRIFARWTQSLTTTGTADIFFYQSGNPDENDTCRVDTGRDMVSLRCGRRAPAISVDGLDVFEPHEVYVSFNRRGNFTLLVVEQGGQRREGVRMQGDTVIRSAPGTIPVTAGDRVAAQISLRSNDGRYLIDEINISEGL